MPPSKEPAHPKQQTQVAIAEADYPPEAFEFVQNGLSYTVQKVHGTMSDPKANRHVSGQQLCEGLRELALQQWGLLAGTVLERWNIHSTLDFGRIVFALIDARQMQRTAQDTLEDFRDVFDFKTAFGIPR